MLIENHPGEDGPIIWEMLHHIFLTIFFFLLFFSPNFLYLLKLMRNSSLKKKFKIFLAFIKTTKNNLIISIVSIYITFWAAGKRKKNCWDNTVDDLETIRIKKKLIKSVLRFPTSMSICCLFNHSGWANMGLNFFRVLIDWRL